MIDEVALLAELTQLLHEDDDVQKLLQTVVDRTALLLKVPRVSAWLFDAERTSLIAGARAGMPLHNKPDFGYRLGQGLIGWIGEHCESIRLAKAEEDPRFLARPGRADPLQSFVGVPIMLGPKRCSGVLSAVAPEPGYFSRHHEQLLMVVAGICADRLALARR